MQNSIQIMGITTFSILTDFERGVDIERKLETVTYMVE
jgi:hypothetical protein